MKQHQNLFVSITVKLLEFLVQLPRLHKQAIVVGLDVALCIVAVWIAFSLRLGLWNFWDLAIQKVIFVSILLMLPIFFAAGVYRAIFRYAGSGAIGGIAKAIGIYFVPMFGLIAVYTLPGVPRTIGVLQPLLLFVLMCLSRISGRYLIVDILGQGKFAGEVKNVVIFGAGQAGQQLAAGLRHEPGMMVRAFVDDDASLDGQKLDGVRVIASSKLERFVEHNNVTDILLALPSISRSKRKEIVSQLKQLSVYVQTLPNMREIVDGKISVTDLRELDVEDLLGRDPVAPDKRLIGKKVSGKVVLITGAGGSIGSELCRQILMVGPSKIVLVEMSEIALYNIEREMLAMSKIFEQPDVEVIPVLASVTSNKRMREVFGSCRPDTVFHAAAYKHVPLVEANPSEGIHNNIFGTLVSARAAKEFGVADFILVSTDKAVRPTNIMGATKRAAEQILQSFADAGTKTRFSMVRFGNVLGSSGSVVPLFRQQISDGGPITLTHKEVTRYFMTIPEAAQLVVQAAAMARGGEVFVLDMGEPVRIHDLAETMVRLSGLSVKNSANPEGDIEIAEVGLRPGEKLYEELLIGDEPTSTEHQRILCAHEHFIEWPKLELMLRELRIMIDNQDDQSQLTLLKKLVPEFTQSGVDAR